MIPVLIESPFAGDVPVNLRYLRWAMRDSLMRGEAPFASHGLYPGALDDAAPEERELGIEAGLTIGRFMHRSAVYVDRGISNGMQRGIRRAQHEMRTVELRRLPDWINGEPPLQSWETRQRTPPTQYTMAALANIAAIELSLARGRHERLLSHWDHLRDADRRAQLERIFR